MSHRSFILQSREIRFTGELAKYIEIKWTLKKRWCFEWNSSSYLILSSSFIPLHFDSFPFFSSQRFLSTTTSRFLRKRKRGRDFFKIATRKIVCHNQSFARRTSGILKRRKLNNPSKSTESKSPSPFECLPLR